MTLVAQIALAAFLHDVGKLFQRAGAPLSEESKRLDSMYCPTSKFGWSTHKHVLWTNQVIDSLDNYLPQSIDRRLLNDVASSHHRPGEPLHWLITAADWLASGHDRREAELDQDQSYLHVPLHNLLASMSFEDQSSDSPPWVTPDHDFERSVQSRSDRPTPNLRPQYESARSDLWGELESWPRLPDLLVDPCLESLFARWLAFTPASTMDEPDVSLYDHSRLVAAFAGALCRYHLKSGDLEDRFDSRSEQRIKDKLLPKFRLVCGDLSGIQGFIFASPPERKSKGFARGFRARSFYLSMLTNVASLELLRELGLPLFNRVIDAGGRFVLLVDNSEETHETLCLFHRRLDDWMVQRHMGTLTLNLNYEVVATGEDFLGNRFQSTFLKMQDAANQAKACRLSTWLQQESKWRTDAACLRESDVEKSRAVEVESLEELGQKLPRAEYCSVIFGSESQEGMLGQSLRLLGSTLQIHQGMPERPIASPNLLDLFRLARSTAGHQSWIPRRPMANYVPLLSREDVSQISRCGPAVTLDAAEESPKPGDIASFGQIAQLSRGTPMIGVLKADVDRLGKLLACGFGSRLSFGRLSSVSRVLNQFFTQYLPARFAKPDSEFRHVYTVFAGGDDLLLVGPWNVMLELAGRLHGWFDQLVCGNADVTISAGLVLGKPKAPINALAGLAGGQLEMSKVAGRNRVTVFDHTLSWAGFKSGLMAGKRLADLATKNERGEAPLPSGFLYRLLQVGKLQEEMACAQKEGRAVPIQSLAWRSHLAYDFKRNVESRLARQRDGASSADDLNWLRELIGLSTRKNSEDESILRLASSYALYLVRGEKE